MGTIEGDDRQQGLIAIHSRMLQAKAIWKRFPGVQALENVDFELHAAEVVALIGENGAGKSTLGKVFGGIHRPDQGQIYLDEDKVQITDVRKAAQLGIALIHQELNLLDNLNVAENIFLGHEPRWVWALFDRKRAYRLAREHLQRVGLDVPPSTPLGKLSTGQQQLVEVAKALSLRARVLVMDEPTSSLTESETQTLIRVIRQLRDEGVGVLFVSHRLGEVQQLADRVVVLRDGKNAGELTAKKCTHDRMVQLMVGRDISQFYQKKNIKPGDVLLDVKELGTERSLKKKISFQLRKGEILGLGGLVGAGRTELVETLFGIRKPWSGQIYMEGKTFKPNSPFAAIQAGLGLVPEDRKLAGLILEMTLRDNITLVALRHITRSFLLRKIREDHAAERMVKELFIRCSHIMQPLHLLSGGNQQKAVLAKWLLLSPKVLILDEPTRGIDVGAKQDIYRLMCSLTEKGTAILMVSSEMEELLAMSDRVLVMNEGEIAGELAKEQLTEANVVSLGTRPVTKEKT